VADCRRHVKAAHPAYRPDGSLLENGRPILIFPYVFGAQTHRTYRPCTVGAAAEAPIANEANSTTHAANASTLITGT
jgi:hypothetical protein